MELINDHGRNPFVLIFRMNPDQIKQYIFTVISWHGSGEISQREIAFHLLFLKPLNNDGITIAKATKLIILIEHKFYVFRVDEAKIFPS